MSMPTWEGFMVPTLMVLKDDAVRKRRELVSLTADVVGLSEEQRAIVLGSGQLMFENRIGWALSQLSRVGALTRPSRGQYQITDAGHEVLATYPNGVTEKQLDALGSDPSSGVQPYTPSTTSQQEQVGTKGATTTLDPTEQVEEGISRIHQDVAAELLERLCAEEPTFFENTVVQLLVAMGYGGIGGRGVTTSKTNDGGIDGIIDQDVLGLNKVYVQAKRYAATNAVQRPEVQGFVGALSGKAESGVFITTSKFTPGAREYAGSIPTRIILVDGAQLASLMIEYNVGVQVRSTYHVVEVDEDFFA